MERKRCASLDRFHSEGSHQVITCIATSAIYGDPIGPPAPLGSRCPFLIAQPTNRLHLQILVLVRCPHMRLLEDILPDCGPACLKPTCRFS